MDHAVEGRGDGVEPGDDQQVADVEELFAGERRRTGRLGWSVGSGSWRRRTRAMATGGCTRCFGRRAGRSTANGCTGCGGWKVTGFRRHGARIPARKRRGWQRIRPGTCQRSDRITSGPRRSWRRPARSRTATSNGSTAPCAGRSSTAKSSTPCSRRGPDQRRRTSRRTGPGRQRDSHNNWTNSRGPVRSLRRSAPSSRERITDLT